MFTKPRQLSLIAAAILSVTPLFNPSANAQVYAPAPPVQAVPQPAAYTLTDDQIDQLTAPIALYPDPLLAQLLPAATFPQDIANAAAFLKLYPAATDATLNAQPWDPSVQAIAHYSSVLTYMANNLDWTQALGAAFVNQPQDVMNSIQRLRAQAAADGSLATNQQQQVLTDNNCIQIVPTDPQTLYIPTYDPNLVYVQSCPIVYGQGFRFGIWLNNGFDWGHHWVTRDFDWAHFRNRRPEVLVHPWVRDNRRPAPVIPDRYINRTPTVRPGYERAAPAPVRTFNPGVGRADIQRAGQRGRAEVPQQVAPPPRPTPPAPRPIPPAQRPTPPAPRPIPPAPRPIPPAQRPTPPAPRPAAPAQRPAPPAQRPSAPAQRPSERPSAPAQRPSAPSAPAFQPSSGDNGASARGHASMHR